VTVKPTFPEAVTADPIFLADVRAGLSKSQKTLSPKYFYDEAGSELFEAITALPEYYPTRTEIGILDERGPEIAALLPKAVALVEFGSGSTAKLRCLLRHLPELSAYVPVDVSGDFLAAQAQTLRADFPNLAVEPVVADFTRPFALPDTVGMAPRAGFFPGSTVGNFEPAEAATLLDRFGEILGPDSLLVLGVDLVKDTPRLEAAYDDAAGVTAAFNMNLLKRINHELGGDFDLEAFRHRAVFNADASRIEMHLVSCKDQSVRIGGDSFPFREGETIHTESSYKYTLDSFRALAATAGWRSETVWTDADALFSVHILRRD